MKVLIFLLTLGLLLLAILYFSHYRQEDQYAKAWELYHKGSLSEDTLVKNQLFNQALEALLLMPSDHSSKNILMGNLLFQLRQSSLSTYYYLRALEQDPDNKEVQKQLQRVIQESKLPTVIPPFQNTVRDKFWFSLLFLIWVAILSWALLTDRKQIQKGVFYLALPLSLYGIYLAGLLFLSPIYGVIIHSQELYQQVIPLRTLSPIPLPSGVVVTVLGEEQKGEWLKVKTEEGVMGYVPEDAIRVLR